MGWIFGRNKEREKICKPSSGMLSKKAFYCGKKHGDKIKKSEEKKGRYKLSRCEKCRKKKGKKRRKTDYEYVCPQCGRGWGFEASNPDDLAKMKKCEKCDSSNSSSGGGGSSVSLGIGSSGGYGAGGSGAP
ncbi:hypothetical protein [Halobellus limi]|uniref:Uncharacterized protein n=1 Tax=Halobellus limi TaxID=699433 RepID=A0A1H5ZE37_9EURY|nr:hypothetical protein [Halobellus limi]SEG34330.1 hypothetical protein SAMN04488133_1951 [Halobellus limi]